MSRVADHIRARNALLPPPKGDDLSYAGSLRAAGAEVHTSRSFGTYQGDWWAKVTLPDARRGWITDRFGSCTGCDAFQAEFGHRENISRAELAEFGAGYFDALLTQTDAETQAAENESWDLDASEAVAFVRENAWRYDA